MTAFDAITALGAWGQQHPRLLLAGLGKCAAPGTARAMARIGGQRGTLATEGYHMSPLARTLIRPESKDVHTYTLEAYLRHNNLIPQFPRTRWRVYTWWLLNFCAELDLSVVKVTVRGQEENAYPLQALQSMARYIAQHPAWPENR